MNEALDFRAAMAWGYAALRARLGILLGLAAVVVVIRVIQAIGSGPLQRYLESVLTQCSDPLSAQCAAAVNANASQFIITTLLMTAVFTAIAGMASYGVYRASLGMTAGRAPLLADMLPELHFGRFVIYIVIYEILMMLGISLCILPGLVVIFFLQLGPFYVLDRGLSMGEAMRASAQAASRNLKPMLLLTVVNVGLMILGGVLFGLLTLVALPFSCLVTAHVYRQVAGESIASPVA